MSDKKNKIHTTIIPSNPNNIEKGRNLNESKLPDFKFTPPPPPPPPSEEKK